MKNSLVTNMKTALASVLLLFTGQANELLCQQAAPGYTLDSTAHYITYVVEIGKNNRGRPIYESILAPKHGIKHSYNSQGKPLIDRYYKYDFQGNKEWGYESDKYFSYNAQSLLTEEVRYGEDSTGTRFYELETFRYNDAGNMLEWIWYGLPFGSFSIDTVVNVSSTKVAEFTNENQVFKQVPFGTILNKEGTPFKTRDCPQICRQSLYRL